MSDIVERLRKQAACVHIAVEPGPAADLEDGLLKAADEIERLRGLLREARVKLTADASVRAKTGFAKNLIVRIDAALGTADQPTGVTQMKVTDEMVNRFLRWKLPDTFAPDGGISFRPIERHPGWTHDSWPVGTNLFTAAEARAMLEYVLSEASQPTDDSTLEPGEEWCMNVAGIVVRLDEWEPGATKRRAADNEESD